MIKREALEPFSLSFLDVISCGFGAVVMLVLIFKFSPIPTDVKQDATVVVDVLNQLVSAQKNLATQQATLESNKEDASASALVSQSMAKAVERLKAARTAEVDQSRAMQRKIDALKQQLSSAQAAGISVGERSEADEEVDGIPVDRKYVIFVVDTSGSMKEIWQRVAAQMDRILKVHPKLVGFQILNDNGKYILSGYAKKWITDTPSMRARMLKLFSGWSASSNSSPHEGLQTALRHYKKYGKDLSIYVLGDDFSGGDFDGVLADVKQLNSNNARIHGLSFISPKAATDRFGTLMREMSLDNDGTFIAL